MQVSVCFLVESLYEWEDSVIAFFVFSYEGEWLNVLPKIRYEESTLDESVGPGRRRSCSRAVHDGPRSAFANWGAIIKGGQVEVFVDFEVFK